MLQYSNNFLLKSSQKNSVEKIIQEKFQRVLSIPPKNKNKIIANIALIGQNPFRACFFKKLTLIRNVKPSQNEKVREGSWEKEIVNGAARIFFGPSYFVTALVIEKDFRSWHLKLKLCTAHRTSVAKQIKTRKYTGITSHCNSREMEPRRRKTSRAKNHHMSPMDLSPLLLQGIAISINLVGESTLANAMTGTLA